MSKMKIYLCGSINGASDAVAKDWRNELKEKLSNEYDFLDPMDRDYRGVELQNIEEIVTNDLADIDSCDVVLYNFVKPSAGSAMEVFYAHRMTNKTVITVNSSGGVLSPWLVYHSHFVFDSMGKAINFLDILEDSIDLK